MRNDRAVVSSLELASHEARRVASHILRAETRARRRSMPHLGGLRRTVRKLLLDELARYRKSARFPKNRDFSDLTPYFIDRDGTRCAMAHLLEVGGERELVRKIASERNNARVKELANEARLIAWLDAAGLTVAEAAEIQPSYCPLPTQCVCFYPPNVPVGVLEGRVLSMTEPLIASVSIEAIHGELPLFSVGEEFDVAVGGAPPSALLIIPVSSYAAERPDIEGPLFYGLGLEPDGTFDCNTANPMMPFGALGGGFPELPPLTKEQYIELVQSETCPASLVELDAAWMPTDCGYGMQPGADAGADAGSEPGETDRLGTVQSDESCGCRVPASNAGEPTTLGIFVALVTALAARRQRRATSSRSTSCFE